MGYDKNKDIAQDVPYLIPTQHSMVPLHSAVVHLPPHSTSRPNLIPLTTIRSSIVPIHSLRKMFTKHKKNLLATQSLMRKSVKCHRNKTIVGSVRSGIMVVERSRSGAICIVSIGSPTIWRFGAAQF
jgi:hypothetical protein